MRHRRPGAAIVTPGGIPTSSVVRATLVAVVAVGLLSACEAGTNPTASSRTVRLDSIGETRDSAEVVLAPGEEAIVDGVLRITFSEVSEDSRCPTDVVCVWQGNAAVVLGLSVGTGPTLPFTLNTGVEPHAAEHGGYRIRLVELDPEPVSTSRIEPEDYRARLRIESAE